MPVHFVFMLALVLVGAAAVVGAVADKTCPASSTAFDVMGLDSTSSFDQFKAVTRQQPLNLAAAGMRRKSVMIMEVDVYKVGIYLSSAKDADAAVSSSNGGGLKLAAPSKEDGISVGIYIQFVRSVGSAKVVDVRKTCLYIYSKQLQSH